MSFSSTTSTMCRLELRYTDKAPRLAPRRLFLKCFIPDHRPTNLAERLLIDAGRREVEFYRVVANHMVAMNKSPVVRCYDEQYSPDTFRCHLLLDDLSDTHYQPKWPLPATGSECEQAIDALARCHAFWWEHPRLGDGIGDAFSAELVASFSRELEETFGGFADFLGDRLSADTRKLYERFFSDGPRRLLGRQGVGRLLEKRMITLTHGDANFWNVLYPRDPAADQIYLIDWQFWHIGVGTDDVAYMIGVHLDSPRRGTLDTELLKRYHNELLAQGVDQYEWADCWNDYRESIVRLLVLPIWQWAVNLPPEIWWPNLDRIVRTFEDAGCMELLEP
jgi:hypothetical protein